MSQPNLAQSRQLLLALFGQANALISIDPLCPDSVEMLEAAKETGQRMKDEIAALLKLVPKADDQRTRLHEELDEALDNALAKKWSIEDLFAGVTVRGAQ